MTRKWRWTGAIGAALATLGALILLYIANSISLYIRVVLAIGALFLSGMAIQRSAGLQGGYGLVAIGSKRGLSLIDRISKSHHVFWDTLAMWGLAMGFGLLAYPLLKGRIDKRVLAFGILCSVFIVLFMLPYFALASQFINLLVFRPVSWITTPPQLQEPQGIILAALTALFGFTGLMLVLLFANASFILFGTAQFLLGFARGNANASLLTNQLPGIAPLIPGVTVPLIPGLLTLLIILVVHEFSHGVLARMAKVKLKSVGVALIGIVPIGAYVELDDRMTDKLGRMKQTKIFSAGISANFIMAFVFFILLFLFLKYVEPGTLPYGVVVSGTIPDYPANGVLQSGMQIAAWNNRTVTNLTSIEAAGRNDSPGQVITVLTDKGFFTFTAVASPENSSRGIIGVSFIYKPITNTITAKTAYFIYALLGLGMLLNFLIGAINLLPLSILDGARIYKANVKNKMITRLVVVLVALGLVLNALPWLFHL